MTAAIEAPPPMTRRVLAVYRSAEESQVEEGLAWYDNAHAVAASLDPKRPRRAAGVIAALSPRTAWPRNLELAARAFADGHASGTMRMCTAAADQILAGADPLEVLRGPKVRAFFTLIADPSDPQTVCVDRHAIDVAIGWRLDEGLRSAWYPLDRRGLYAVFAERYQRAARRVGILPSQMQAVTWVSWRAHLYDDALN